MSYEYGDYNNEEPNYYNRVIDPREHNVVARIKELRDYKHPIIEDDKVSIERMKHTHNNILDESVSTDNEIKKDIDTIKKDIEDDGSFIVVGDNS